MDWILNAVSTMVAKSYLLRLQTSTRKKLRIISNLLSKFFSALGGSMHKIITCSTPEKKAIPSLKLHLLRELINLVDIIFSFILILYIK